MSSTPAKDTIYIDVDDEITAIIDKVRSSKSKIIALVLPKRATTLQSLVNMKLLKRKSDEEKKHLVLITSEAGLMPLAAATEMYVAQTLQSKPEIPAIPQAGAGGDVDGFEDAVALDDDAPIDKNATVGELSKATTVTTEPEEAIDFDNTSPKKSADSGKKNEGKKDKSLKVPNFNRFRKWFILGGIALVVLIALGYICFSVLPKASILVKTDSEAVSATSNVTLNTQATKVDVEDGIVPAQSQQVQKTYTQQSPATGEQNNGQKASGSIQVVNCNDQTITLAAGTGFSSGNYTFISQEAVQVPGSNFTSGGNCKRDGQASVNVIAQKAGAAYNLPAGNFVIATSPSGATASSGNAMTGGTDNITKIIQQSDIDSAKQKIEAQDTTAIKKQLEAQLSNAGLYPVSATFSAGAPAVTTSANAGDPGDSVSVTEKVNYTMLGTKKSDLEKIITASVDQEIDPQKQSILDYGLDHANFSTPSALANGSVTTTMQVTVVAGPDLNIDELKKQVAGKKSGDAKKIISSYPGVTDVTITYSPFWVTSIPKNVNKITITIDKPQVQTDATKEQ